MKTPRHLKTDIVWRLMLTTSVALLTVGLLAFSYLAKKTSESIQEKNELLVKAVTGEVRGLLMDPYSRMKELQVLLSSHIHNDIETNNLMDLTVRNVSYFESLYLIDREGTVINVGLPEHLSAKQKDFIGLDLSGQKYFSKTIAEDKPLWSDVALSPITGHISLSLSLPSENGILVGSFSIEHLYQSAHQFEVGEKIIISMFDNKGVLIFHQDKALMEQHLNMKNLPIINMAVTGDTVTSRYSFQGVDYIGSVSKIQETGWVILLSQTIDSAYASVVKTRYIFFGGMSLAILIVAYLALLTSKTLVRPLSHFRDTAQAIAGGDYNADIPAQGHKEIEDLAVSFRNMAAAIQNREDEIKKSEERYRMLVETMNDGIVVVDSDNIVTYANPRLSGMLGYSDNEIPGCNIMEFFDAANREVMEEQLIRRRRGESGIYEIEWRKKGGDTMVTMMSPVPLYDEAGNYQGSFAVVRDITEQKRSEEAVRLSEEKFSKAFRASPAFLTITTLEEGRFIDVNDAFLKKSGYERNEIIGRTSLELNMWPDLKERDRIRSLLRSHDVVSNQEIKTRTKSGEIITILWSAEKINIEDNACVIAASIDVSERKKLEGQLLQAQKMEAIGQLAGGVAHDFNNILTAIINYAHMLKLRLKDDADALRTLDKITSLSDRATNLTQGLLTFSRKQYFEYAPKDLNALVMNVEKLLSQFIREDITMKTRLSPGNLSIIADKTQIEQVILNLVTNARDAMPDGGELLIETDLIEIDDRFINTQGFGSPGMYAVLSVSDTGTGMDEETKARIYDPFFSTKAVGKGTGLGLAIVYGIVKQHNGYITIHSEPGKGTTFKIYLPRTASAVIEELDETLPLLTGQGETILIAEDEETVRDSMKLILQEFGYTVITAVDGRDAIEQFKKNKDAIQLLILDVVMPGLNGKETFDAIKAINPAIRVIFTSGYTADIIHRKKTMSENSVFVSKPIVPDKFLMKIKEVLA